MRGNIEQVWQQRRRECQNSRTLQGERVGWRSSVRYQNSPPEQILGRAQNSASSAPIVLVETYIRRRFVKLAFHDFDGCHPRRGAGRLCQQSGTGHDDDQSGEPCESFHCDPPVPAVGIERLSHGPRSLYEAFHTPSAGKDGALRSDLPIGSDRGVAGGPVVFGAVPSQITVMPAHRFRVGQTVVVLWSGPQVGIPLGPYVIVRLLPVEFGEPHYRVRSSVDGHERALLESQIRLREEKPAPVEAPSAKPARRRR